MFFIIKKFVKIKEEYLQLINNIFNKLKNIKLINFKLISNFWRINIIKGNKLIQFETYIYLKNNLKIYNLKIIILFFIVIIFLLNINLVIQFNSIIKIFIILQL